MSLDWGTKPVSVGTVDETGRKNEQNLLNVSQAAGSSRQTDRFDTKKDTKTRLDQANVRSHGIDDLEKCRFSGDIDAYAEIGLFAFNCF